MGVRRECQRGRAARRLSQFPSATRAVNMPSVSALSVATLVCVVAATFASELKIEKQYEPDLCEVKSKNGDMLTMHYIGTLEDGTKFDSR